ncbi:calcineurin-like phosphoesterase family protein [Paraflavitalea sp. CAU 1676]|uniref:calcineurin-like phosphoesterase family protein n=1 Tax=Paraflavitalea sp. CAU 1676 TaxID=3032598 RepID=UPI0023DC265F|nr:calcineurin-like phosphoesterase family protein [Paraflavitalea sp. CAU 1676]MDF2192294.1 calcineurin-like phosphoesterase family protein [Paraflavitalea sp. CAU 1676]
MLNRRSFLKNFGLAGAAFTTPAAIAHAAPISYNTGLVIKGRVQSNGNGIAGVAVTDGYTVTTTDKKGNYSINAHSAAEFVYISIPAGHAFPNEKGIAQFYQPITSKEGSVKADFTLEKLAADDTKHQFVVWADTQIISEKDGELLKKESAPDLKQLVASYPQGSLFHGIGCGDLVWDHFELFDDYKEAVGISGVPFFNVIGNHDMDIDGGSDDVSAKTFKKQFGPTYYSFNRGKVHYIVLDNVFFIGTAKKYIGYLTEAQLSWLAQDLALVKPGSTVVVGNHIPTDTGNQRRNKLTEEAIGGTVANRNQLYKLLKPYKVHIMSGHTHVNEKWEKDNMIEHVHGTVCGAWWTGPICSDGTPNGYGVYEVDGDDIKWYYKSTGKEKDHQLRVYKKGKLANAPDEVVANVWNWDPKWKIEWWEDDQAKGLMEQRVEFDPWSVELHGGPQLPKKHKFVEPTLTDHLFFAKPSAAAKKITVQATDRFGNVFKETIQLV